MKQAIHIFRKDVRHLWPQILVVLGLQLTFVMFEIRPNQLAINPPLLQSREGLVDLLLPLTWWYLIVSLVHEEPLPGNRQFWITRPYSRKSLLGAKALFILAFINLPLLIADCVILTSQGFAVTQHPGGLAFRHIPFTAFVLLPPLALGSLTRNVGQAIMAVLLIILRAIVNIPFSSRVIRDGATDLDWIVNAAEDLMMVLVLIAVVFIGYRYRRLLVSGAIAAALVLIPGISVPLKWQLMFQSFVKPAAIDPSPIRISLDPGRKRRSPAVYGDQAIPATIAFPVRVSGAPDGVEVKSSGAQISIEENGRRVWTYDFELALLQMDTNGYWESISIPRDVFGSLRERPVTIRLEPVLTAFRTTEFQTPLRNEIDSIPEVGICQASLRTSRVQVDCRSAWQLPPPTSIHADYPGWDRPDPQQRPRTGSFGASSDSPLPAELGLTPVRRNEALSLFGPSADAAMDYPGTQLIFRTQHPLAHFQTAIEITNVRLDDYVVSAPGR